MILAEILAFRPRGPMPGLEEDWDAHAHPHGLGDAQLLGFGPEALSVLRKVQKPMAGDIRRDNPEPESIARIVIEFGINQIGEGSNPPPLEQLRDPMKKGIALAYALLHEDAQRLADDRDLLF